MREKERKKERGRECDQEKGRSWWCLLSNEGDHLRKTYRQEMEGTGKEKRVETSERGSKVCDGPAIHRTRPSIGLVESTVRSFQVASVLL